MERHPWNTSFTWSPPAGPHRIFTSAQAAEFDRDGCVILRDVIGGDDIAAVRDEIDAIEARTEAWLRQQNDERMMIAEAGAITFSVHLVKSSARARAFTCHPWLLDIVADVVGPDANLYWDQAVYKKPEKPRRFPWHQDNGYTFVEPQQYLTCWVPLTDATIENGCPQVVPGVHREGTLFHRYVEPLGYECFAEPPVTPRPAPARVGDVVVFSSLTPHLTGPNTTDAVRKAYIVQYAPAGARIQRGDPTAGPPASTEPCDDPDRQFAVLRGGEPAVTSP